MGTRPIRKHYLKGDDVIDCMVEDPNFDIREDGTIWTKVSAQGWISNKWRRCDILDKIIKSNTYYRRVRYGEKWTLAHRLVYRKFGGKLKGLEINHIDGNGLNNNISNLELVTRAENLKHSYEVLGRVPSNRRRNNDLVSL